jgi:putative flippase GtrA
MFARLRSHRFVELFRYYQAGIVNTLFGLGAYAVLVWAGFGIYAAQLISHVLGMSFNYVTYSRHVFRDAGPAKARFVLSYAINYLLSLAALAVIAHLVNNPYIAGFLAAFIVSIVNYFALKHVVFRKKAT